MSILLQPSTYFILIAFLIPWGEIQQKYYLVKICILLLLFTGIADRVIKKQPLRKSPLDLPLLIFIFSFIFSFAYEYEFGELQSAFLSMVAYFILIVMISNFVTDKYTLNRIITAFIISTVAVSIFGILQFSAGVSLFSETSIDRFRYIKQAMFFIGTAANPNAFAVHFLLAIPLAFSRLLLAKTIINRVLWIITIILFLVCLIMTFARGGILGAAGGVLLVCYFYVKEKKLRPRAIVVTLLCGYIILNIFWRFYPQYSVEGFNAVAKYRGFFSVKSDSTDVRKHIYKANFLLFLDNPLIGVGYDRSKYHIYKYDILARHYTPHNIFLGLASENGLMGLVPFLYIIFMISKKTLRSLKHVRDPVVFSLLTGLFGAYIAFLINGLVHMSIVSVSLWMFTGLLIAGTETIAKDAI